MKEGTRTKKPSLKDAVYRTVAWFGVFHQPVLAEEVQRALFGMKAELWDVKKALYEDTRLGKTLGLFYLKGQESTVMQRYRRTALLKKLWDKVNRYLFLFRLVPFVRMIAVGNTLAFGWAEEESDIDIFVVAAPGRLFIARTFLTFFTSLLRVRRHGNKVKERFCLSFLVDERAQDTGKLAIPGEDPYLAFWTANLKLIVGESRSFVKANAWVREVFPGLPKDFVEGRARESLWTTQVVEWVLGGHLGNWLERRLALWQMKRAEAKKKNSSPNAVVITTRILKFHESDRREEYRSLHEAMLVKKVVRTVKAQKV